MATTVDFTKKIWDKYSAEVANVLGLPVLAVPRIEVVASMPHGYAAVWDNGTLRINSSTEKVKQDVGVIIHEMTHAYQASAGQAGNSSTASEAQADAVRYIIQQAHPKAEPWAYVGWAPSTMAKQMADVFTNSPGKWRTVTTNVFSGTYSDTQYKSQDKHLDLSTASATATTTPTPSPSSSPPAAQPGTGTAGGQISGGGSSTYPNNNPNRPPAPGSTGPAPPALSSSTTPPGPIPPGFHYETDPKTGNQVLVPDGHTLAGDQAASQQAKHNQVANFTSMVQGWGIGINNNINQLIQQGVNQGWDTNHFITQLQDTPEFQQRFPGIFNAQGGLKMSPDAYIVQEKAYGDVAAQAGININDQKMAYLFKNNVSAAEFQTRAAAIGSLRQNADMFKAFGQQLAQMGLAPQGGLSKQDLFKFVTGQGNAQWTQVWQDASSRYAGEQAGITFGNKQQGYTNLGQGVVQSVGQKGLSLDQLTTGYKDLAHQLMTTFPESKIQSMGLSKKDLVQLEFGGPRQAAISQKVQQIMDNETAFNQGQVTTATAPGLGAARGSQEKYAQSQ